MSKLFILGPCAAETREQVITTAEQLNSQLSIYRAGIWKPRTSPNSFQGVGEAGLPWLQEVSETYSVPVATEVATPEHVKAALRACVQYIWIGARTAANPIAVQAIADALTSINSPTPLPLYSSTPKLPKAVLIKNPVNEDVNLWIGNIERLQATGIPVMAVHRGCNHKPCWEMAFELRRRMPNVPLLLDPSHMSGDAAQVPSLCQLAMDLDYDGLMMEVHCDPAHALSDAKQQLTPAQAIEVISHLHYRDNSIAAINAIDAIAAIDAIDRLPLAELRSEIDELDDNIWSLIAKRIAVAKQIGDYKREHNLPVLQAKRYDEILQRRLEWAKKNGVSADAVQSILETLHNECVSVQL